MNICNVAGNANKYLFTYEWLKLFFSIQPEPSSSPFFILTNLIGFNKCGTDWSGEWWVCVLTEGWVESGWPRDWLRPTEAPSRQTTHPVSTTWPRTQLTRMRLPRHRSVSQHFTRQTMKCTFVMACCRSVLIGKHYFLQLTVNSGSYTQISCTEKSPKYCARYPGQIMGFGYNTIVLVNTLKPG